jgi:hypothetical protein
MLLLKNSHLDFMEQLPFVQSLARVTLGVGLDVKTGELFFTKNGKVGMASG